MTESSGSTGVRLLEAGVVVLADELEPEMFTPPILKALGIVPDSWKVVAAFATPAHSILAFEGGARVQVNQSEVDIVHPCGPDLGDNYDCHAAAAAFLGKFSNLPYRHLGMNCLLAREQPDPGRWLVERFGAKSLLNDDRVASVQPAFAYPLGDAVCNIGLYPGTLEGRPCILVRCNLHHEGPLSADRMQSAIAGWRDYQGDIAAAAANLLEVEKA